MKTATAKVNRRTRQSGVVEMLRAVVSGGKEAEEQAVGPDGEDEAGGAAGEGEEKAFDEKLADDAAAAGAEREADGDFLFARGGAGDEEAGDVGAGDEEDAGGEEHQDPEGLGEALTEIGAALGAGEGVDDAFDEVGALVSGGVAEGGFLHFHFEHGMEIGLEGGFRLLDGDAGLEAAEGVDPTPAAVLEAVPERGHPFLHHDGDPDLGNLAKLDAVEAGLGDADDGVAVAVEDDALADDGGVGGEAGFPEIKADHGDGVGVGSAVVVFGEGAADGGADAEDGEVSAGDELGGDTLGFAVEAETGFIGEAAEHAGEDGVVVAEVVVHGPGDGVAAPVASVVVAVAGEEDETLRLLDGEEAEEDLIEEAEDGGVGSDAEGERGDGDGGEDGGFGEGAEGEAEIADQSVHR